MSLKLKIIISKITKQQDENKRNFSQKLSWFLSHKDVMEDLTWWTLVQGGDR